jgi:hypothetical protein
VLSSDTVRAFLSCNGIIGLKGKTDLPDHIKYTDLSAPNSMNLGRKTKSPQAGSTISRRLGIKFTSARCLYLSKLVWEWSLATLPVDIFIFILLGYPALALEKRNELLAVVMMVAAVGLLKEQLFNAVERLRLIQQRLRTKHIIIFMLVLGLLAVAELIAKIAIQPIGGIPILAGMAALIVIGFSGWRSMQQLRKDGERFLKDRFAQVEQANTLHLGAVVVPILGARLVSLITAVGSSELSSVIFASSGALVLVLALFPRESDFMAPCQSCHRITSRVLKADGCCPHCNPGRFLN